MSALFGPAFALCRPPQSHNSTLKRAGIAAALGIWVVGSPYHRNTDGILDSFAILTTTDSTQARSILARRNVDFVILCVDSEEENYFLSFEGDTLMHKIVTATQPNWLKKITLPDDLNKNFRVFRVDPIHP